MTDLTYMDLGLDDFGITELTSDRVAVTGGRFAPTKTESADTWIDFRGCTLDGNRHWQHSRERALSAARMPQALSATWAATSQSRMGRTRETLAPSSRSFTAPARGIRKTPREAPCRKPSVAEAAHVTRRLLVAPPVPQGRLAFLMKADHPGLHPSSVAGRIRTTSCPSSG